MCGPIALALPIHHQDSLTRVFSILSYNFGRIVTYSFLGLIFGLLGASIFIGKYQQVLSIAIGVLILIVLIVPRMFSFVSENSLLVKFQTLIQRKLSVLFQQEKKMSTLFFIGVLNGFLPCGLVYMALAGALVSGSTVNGVLFMSMFGFATVPIMFAVSYFGNFVSVSFRSQIRKAVPFVIGLMAVLLILRGLNLGIPYLSPQIEQTEEGLSEGECHKPVFE
jgi:sulfite exporter TauE/SafE